MTLMLFFFLLINSSNSSSSSGGLSVTQDLKPKMVKMFQSSNIAKQTMFWKKNNNQPQ